MNSFTIFLSFVGSFGLIFIPILLRLLHLRKHIFFWQEMCKIPSAENLKVRSALSTRGDESKGLAMRASKCLWQKLEV